MTLVVMALAMQPGELLLVQEKLPGNPWYVPAGRVEPDESTQDALWRECLEEAGVAPTAAELVAVQHRWDRGQPWIRFVFRVRIAAGAVLKTEPDEHSLAAAWTPLNAVRQLDLRSRDFLELLPLIDAPALPLRQVQDLTEKYK